MNIPSFRIMPVAAAVIMLLVAGCGSGSVGSVGSVRSSASASARPDPELPDITVAALPAADLAGLYIAQDEGLFARQGLHVTIEPIASSQAVITAQLKGQVDIGAGSYIPYISAQAAGAEFRVLAEASTLHPDTRVLVLVTTESSPIVTVGQLVGRQIGVNGTNSIGTLLISVLLSDRGISPAKVRLVTDAEGFSAMPAEPQAGAWSAAFLAEPYVTYAGEKYGERILADLDQGSALNFPIDGYVATLGRVGSTSLFIAAGGNCVGALLGGLIAARFGITAPYWAGFVLAALVSAGTWRVFNRAAVAEAYAEPALSGAGSGTASGAGSGTASGTGR
jgi:ABC-type nitrate/sulfonate/bicarbonate transport system substrate-binding protein